MATDYRTRCIDLDTGLPKKWNGTDWEDDLSGSGDMLKSVYDPDEDGLIAEAELVLDYPTHSNVLDHPNSLDHTQGTDQALDTGGANEVSAANAKAAYTHSQAAHAPSNAQKNSDILKPEIEAVLIGELSSHSHASGGGESEVVVVKTGDTANATINLADATELTFEALANSLYIIEVFLVWDTSVATVGIKVSATASGSPTLTRGHFIADAIAGTPDSSTYNANDVVTTTSASPYTAGGCGMLHAILKTGTSASTWTLRFAAETTGTITIKAGSVLRYRKVA